MSGRLVTVVLPCHDVEVWVDAALDAILAQSWTELDVLAVDDGSRDGTRARLDDRAERDARVRVVVNEGNLGLIETLNRAVADARGAFVARMDADDLCHPERIARQVARLDAHPEVGVIGTGAWTVDGEGRRVGTRPARCTTPAGARFLGLLATPLVHGSIVARVEVMRAHRYGAGEDSAHTEDYELFARMLAEGVGLANLPDELYGLRVHPGSVSRAHEDVQVDNFVACARRHLARTVDVDVAEGAHRVLVNRMRPSTTADHLRDGMRALDLLERTFLEREEGAAAEVRAVAAQQRVDILGQALLKGSTAVRAAAVPLLARHAPSLLSASGRRHLALKLARGDDPESR
jgi:glycosyltransferase involved in cell wall biosynthesis